MRENIIYKGYFKVNLINERTKQIVTGINDNIVEIEIDYNKQTIVLTYIDYLDWPIETNIKYITEHLKTTQIRYEKYSNKYDEIRCIVKFTELTCLKKPNIHHDLRIEFEKTKHSFTFHFNEFNVETSIE